MLVTAGSLLAHHALAQFDTTTAVKVKGTVVLFHRVNPHSLLVLDEKREDGQTHRWVVEGPNALQLTRRQIGYGALQAGDIVEVCGYITRPGIESQRTISMEALSSKTSYTSLSGQFMDGELLVMADGKKEVWSDYGHHKCFPPDYTDIHTK
jgi:Family of unknown function (DUF6152)